MTAPPMPDVVHRTIVYVDGFNFYYGAVKGTPWKWLNPEELFERALGGANAITAIKYFTARVQPSPNDPDVNVRQDAYLRAVRSYCPRVQLFYGHFLRPIRKWMLRDSQLPTLIPGTGIHKPVSW